jgi:trans-aconitate 2-methyltransferase
MQPSDTVRSGDWNADLYDQQHSFVWKRGADVLELLAPRAGERILDLGCGTGHLTAQIADTGADVLGIDSDPAMIERARAAYPQVRFEVADATRFNMAAEFDAVFSNAAIHWMKPPAQVAANIAHALKPQGRFVAEFGGRGNIGRIAEATYAALRAMGYPEPERASPWYFPSIAEYATLLEQQGLEATFAVLFDRPTPLEGGEDGMRQWLEMFTPTLLAVAPESERPTILRDIEARLRPMLHTPQGWVADYRRLRIVAVKPDVRLFEKV